MFFFLQKPIFFLILVTLLFILVEAGRNKAKPPSKNRKVRQILRDRKRNFISKKEKKPSTSLDKTLKSFNKTSKSFKKPLKTFYKRSKSFNKPSNLFYKPSKSFKKPSKSFKKPSESFYKASTSFNKPSESFNKNVSSTNKKMEPEKRFFKGENAQKHYLSPSLLNASKPSKIEEILHLNKLGPANQKRILPEWIPGTISYSKKYLQVTATLLKGNVSANEIENGIKMLNYDPEISNEKCFVLITENQTKHYFPSNENCSRTLIVGRYRRVEGNYFFVSKHRIVLVALQSTYPIIVYNIPEGKIMDQASDLKKTLNSGVIVLTGTHGVPIAVIIEKKLYIFTFANLMETFNKQYLLADMQVSMLDPEVGNSQTKWELMIFNPIKSGLAYDNGGKKIDFMQPLTGKIENDRFSYILRDSGVLSIVSDTKKISRSSGTTIICNHQMKLCCGIQLGNAQYQNKSELLLLTEGVHTYDFALLNKGPVVFDRHAQIKTEENKKQLILKHIVEMQSRKTQEVLPIRKNVSKNKFNNEIDLKDRKRDNNNTYLAERKDKNKNFNHKDERIMDDPDNIKENMDDVDNVEENMDDVDNVEENMDDFDSVENINEPERDHKNIVFAESNNVEENMESEDEFERNTDTVDNLEENMESEDKVEENMEGEVERNTDTVYNVEENMTSEDKVEENVDDSHNVEEKMDDFDNVKNINEAEREYKNILFAETNNVEENMNDLDNVDQNIADVDNVEENMESEDEFERKTDGAESGNENIVFGEANNKKIKYNQYDEGNMGVVDNFKVSMDEDNVEENMESEDKVERNMADLDNFKENMEREDEFERNSDGAESGNDNIVFREANNKKVKYNQYDEGNMGSVDNFQVIMDGVEKNYEKIKDDQYVDKIIGYVEN